MGYVVVSPCLPTSSDAFNYASSLPPGYQVLSCTSVSSFVELTSSQKHDLFIEGLQLGAGVAGVWVVAWCVFILRRAL